jgi:hypothetical protein
MNPPGGSDLSPCFRGDSIVCERANTIFYRLRQKLPALPLREILEAVMGLKCSRISLGSDELHYLKNLSNELNFGIAVSDSKTISKAELWKGSWSDRVPHYVPLDYPEGLYTIYVGPNQEEAIAARFAEEVIGDEAFGKLLQIPSCCRNFYSDRQDRSSSEEIDYLWEVVETVPNHELAPLGANILGQYFDRCLLSHFPCSLQCEASRKESLRRSEILSKVAPELVAHLTEGHLLSALVIKGKGILAYSDANVSQSVLRPSTEAKPQITGTILNEFPSVKSLHIDNEGLVIIEDYFGDLKKLSPDRARLVIVGSSW